MVSINLKKLAELVWLLFKRLNFNVWVVCLLRSYCSFQFGSLSLKRAVALHCTRWMWIQYVVGNLGFS